MLILWVLFVFLTASSQAEEVLQNENYLNNTIACEDKTEKLLVDVKQIKIPGYPKAWNPSLLKYKKGFLLTFRYTPGPSTFESYIGVIQLDENLNPISKPEILTNRQNNITSRLQDARIFTYKENMYVVYCDNQDPVYRINISRKDTYISQLVYEKGHFKLLPPLKLIYPAKYHNQLQHKNWVPIVWNDQLLFAYYINPHEIIVPNLTTGECSLLSITSFDLGWEKEWGQLRGGTPAVLVDGEYLAFFHSSIHEQQNILYYYFGAYTFSPDPPFNITKISPKPILDQKFYKELNKKSKIVFPGGIVVVDDQIYMAYGKNDKEVWIAKFRKKSLMRTLIEVGK